MAELEDILSWVEQPSKFPRQEKTGKKASRKLKFASLGALLYGGVSLTLPVVSLEGSLITAGFGAGIGLVAESNQRLAKGFRQYRKKVLDYVTWPLEKPELAAIATGILATGAIAGNVYRGLAYDQILLDPMQMHAIAVAGGIAGTITYGGLTLLSRLAHSQCFRAYGTRLNPTNESLVSLLQLPHSREKEASIHIQLASQELRAANFWQASEQYIEAMRCKASEEYSKGISDWIIPKARKSFGAFTIKDRMHYSIREGTKAFFNGKLDDADLHFRNAIKASPETRLAHIAYATFLRAAAPGDAALHERALRHIEAYKDLLLMEGSGVIIPAGEGRNKILAIKSEHDAYDHIRIKMGNDAKGLKNEHDAAVFLRAKVGDAVANPVGFFPSGEELVLETAPGPTLLQLVKEKRHTIEDIIEAATLHAQIQNALMAEWKKGHGRRRIELEEAIGRHSTYYEDRLKTVFLNQVEETSGIMFSDEFRHSLLDDAYPIFQRLYSLEEIRPYQDANLKNFIKSGKMTKIDFERLRLLPAHLDLVNLLEFQYNYLDDEQKDKVIKAYLKEAGITQKFSKFKEDYEFAAFQRHLELVGYRSRDANAEGPDTEENRAAMKFHFLKAKQHLETIIGKHYLGMSDTNNLKVLVKNMERESEKFGAYETKSKVKKILEERAFGAKSASVIAAAGLLFLATTGTLSLANRVVPIINMPISTGSYAAYVQEIGGEFTFFAHDASSGLNRLFRPISSKHFSISPSGDKALLEENDIAAIIDLMNKSYSRLSDEKGIDLPVFAPDSFKIIAGRRGSGLFREIVELNARSKDVVIKAVNASANSFSWAPNSKYFVYFSPDELQSNATIVDIIEAEYVGPKWPVKTPELFSWSPDSDKIVYSDGRAIYLAEDLRNSDSRAIYTGSSPISRLKWQAENSIVFSQEGVIKSINPKTLEEKEIGMGSNIELSPNNMLIGYIFQGDVFVYDSAKGTSRNISNSPEDETEFAFLPQGKRIILVQQDKGIQNVLVIGVNGSNTLQLTMNTNPLAKYYVK